MANMNLRMPTREEIHAAFEQGEAAIVELFLAVERQLEELAGQLEQQAMASNSRSPRNFTTISIL